MFGVQTLFIRRLKRTVLYENGRTKSRHIAVMFALVFQILTYCLGCCFSGGAREITAAEKLLRVVPFDSALQPFADASFHLACGCGNGFGW